MGVSGRRPRVVREAARLGLAHRDRWRVLLECRACAREVCDEVGAELAAEAVAHEHALHRLVHRVARGRVV